MSYHRNNQQQNVMIKEYNITIAIMSFHRNSNNHEQQPEMVGNLQLKRTNHWDDKIDDEYCTDRGITMFPQQQGNYWDRSYINSYKDKRPRLYDVKTAMVALQRSLFKAAKCEGKTMNLTGEFFKKYWNKKDKQVKEYYRTPFHDDILENWEAFVEDLKSYDGGIESFNITRIMLPESPFFSTSIMPIITANITTITSLELVNCDLKASDVRLVSTFVKKNKLLEVLNLSQNELFGSDESNSAAKQLSKAMKNHPELSFVSLASTGLGGNNDGLKLILDGSKVIKSLIIDGSVFDNEGLTLVTKFLRNKNSTVELGMDSIGIGEGDSSKAKSKLLKECLEKNTTLEQLSLGSNNLGNAEGRVLSTVLSGIKASTSLAFVDLSGNNIRTMPSVKLVAKYLASNPTLIGLDLSNNGIPAKSASVLIATLKKNTNLKQLYLMNNNVTDQSIPAFTDALQNNNTLRTLDLMGNNFSSRRLDTTKNNFVGRKEILKALCDTTSLDSIANNSNHTCNLILAGCNYSGSHEVELNKINALENEGEKIRYKVVLALCVLNKDLYNPRVFEDVPLELMPKLLQLVQQEIGCNGYGEGIVKSVKKRNTINRLSNIYEAIHQWPAFPSLFDRGPGKGSLTKTGKLKRKREMSTKKKVADEDEDFVPNGFRKTKKRKRRWQWQEQEARWRFTAPEPEPVKPSRSSSRVTNIASISYADAENSEDES